MKKYIWKILCIAACVVIGLSVTLPYFSVSGLGLTVSKSLMDGDYGIFVLIVAGIALVLSVLGQYMYTAFAALACVVLSILQNQSLTVDFSKVVDGVVKSMIDHGPGYYCLLAGSAALAVFSVIGLEMKRRSAKKNK